MNIKQLFSFGKGKNEKMQAIILSTALAAVFGIEEGKAEVQATEEGALAVAAAEKNILAIMEQQETAVSTNEENAAEISRLTAELQTATNKVEELSKAPAANLTQPQSLDVPTGTTNEKPLSALKKAELKARENAQQIINSKNQG